MKEILELKTLLTGVDIKLATSSDVTNGSKNQILAVVTTKDSIVLRYVTETADIILRRVDWFQQNEKNIQDIALDPSSTWLLVLCLDNTLHIVPVLGICDKSLSFRCIFAPNEITSFIVPFIGPHECPNPQKCPNHVTETSMDIFKRNSGKRNFTQGNRRDQFSTSKVDELISGNGVYNTFYCDQKPNVSSSSSVQKDSDGVASSTSSTPVENNVTSISSSVGMEESVTSSESVLSSCPFPTAVIWWKTHMEENRAIIGYSDGCIAVVLLATNCPFVGNTIIEKNYVEKFVICRDSCSDTVSLMINTFTKEQYKMLLEQKSTSFTFPGEMKSILEQKMSRDAESDWEVVSTSSNTDLQENGLSTGDQEPSVSTAGDLKSRLLSLRDLGAKKIGNLKLKLAESRIKKDKEKKNEQFTMINSNTAVPELLTTPSGPSFIVQKTQNKTVMSAIHSYSDTLSIHNIEIMMIPSSLYKLPPHTRNVMLTENLLFIHQYNASQQTLTETTPVNSEGVSATLGQSMDPISTSANATNSSQSINNYLSKSEDENIISVISCALATTKIGDDCEFNERSLLGSFNFPSDERILNIFLMTSVEKTDDVNENQSDEFSHEVEVKSIYSKYLSYQSKLKNENKFDENDRKVLKTEFPRVNYEKCLIVTSRGVYCVEFKDKPHATFLSLASTSQWTMCDDFCKTFNLNMAECVEFSGDIMLKKKKIEQALLTYNIARIPPIKTALKLAMFSETSALRQISAMALKISFVLESKHPLSYLIREILKDSRDRHEKCDTIIKNLRDRDSKEHENEGITISDFSYDNENNFEIQMSNSAQFHLSNLLFLTLCERCVKDKNLMPLWNFVVSNMRYHTSLSSIILSQSGLYSTAVLLAMHRGACLDVFSCLVSTADHVLDISNEMSVYMYNLSDEIFMETIVYLQNFGLDYFEIIRNNLNKFDIKIVERLMKQLDPFNPIYRPILFKVKNQTISKDMENFVEFCKTLIEIYILVLIRMQRLLNHKDNFLNALNVFRVTSEERQNHVSLTNFSPITAGFSNAGCVVNNSVYLWGKTDIVWALNKNILQSDSTEFDNLATRVDFFRDINLEVMSVHCGRSHVLFLTNNGLYAMGSNQQGQLGIDRIMNVALQPMLIRDLDGKIITQVCAGQHHNAVVADNILYTWGWNIYGQLGHGGIKLVRQPKIVEFFKDKKIKQVALGQAHTVVLTSEKIDDLNTSVYVFGSNHYGQLGVGEAGEIKKSISTSTVPLRIKLSENIRLIHTNYFVNFAVTESNKLLTWGLSPPELRIINQSKKRAKANQKLKESMQENGNVTLNYNNESPETSQAPVESSTSNITAEENVGMEITSVPRKTVPEIKIDEVPTSIDPEATTSTKEPEINEELFSAEEFIGHLRPSEVDTSEVDGDIIYISSGIYHYALITTQSSLFMWGKNIERQLGRESVKPDLIIPTKHQSLVDAKFVECGADFTLVVTNENELKAFGNNNNGQCGVENVADKPASAGKLIRFKSSKRVFRIPESSMYLHYPKTVRIPASSPISHIEFFENKPTCQLKNLPKFKKNCLIESSLSKYMRRENLLIFDEHIINNNHNSFSSLSSVASTYSSASKSSDDSMDEEDYKKSNDYIHYCMFLFQGLYDSTRFYCKSVEKIVSPEYKIRVLMLDFNYIEAFKIALEVEGTSANISIKIFEYFTTDSNIIPMHTDDIKFFVYDIFRHFIKNQFDVAELEKYFIYNLDYYFLQLAFILYFCGSNNNNNNNNAQQQNGLEKQLFDKFKHLYSNHENFAYFDNNEVERIFKSISTSFHCSLCQSLLKYSENIN